MMNLGKIGACDEKEQTNIERQRQRGLDLLKSGMKPTEVEGMLGVDRSTVYRWKKEWPHRKREKKRGTPSAPKIG